MLPSVRADHASQSSQFKAACVGSQFCALTSVVLIAYMVFMGILIKKDYPCAPINTKESPERCIDVVCAFEFVRSKCSSLAVMRGTSKSVSRKQRTWVT